MHKLGRMYDGNLFETLSRYYAESGDRRSKVVDFHESVPSQFLRESQYVSQGKEDFTILDSFGGLMPIVLNYDFLVAREERLGFVVEIILDSNAASHVHSYVSDRNGTFRRSSRGIATHHLLRKLAEYSQRGWHFTHLFYLLEAAAKNEFQVLYPSASAIAQSITEVQLMRDELFLQTGQIEPDPEKMKEFSELFPMSSIDSRTASDILYVSTSPLLAQAGTLIKCIYASLMMIVLIDRQPKTSPRKLELFFEFLNDEIGSLLSWESLLACFKFGGRGSRLVSFKKDPAETRRALMASAWDLLLLRLPELAISNEVSEYTTLCYVCTAEKALQKIGRMRSLRRVASALLEVPIVTELRTDILAEEVGPELARKYVELNERYILSSGQRRSIGQPNLDFLVSELEARVRGLS